MTGACDSALLCNNATNVKTYVELDKPGLPIRNRALKVCIRQSYPSVLLWEDERGKMTRKMTRNARGFVRTYNWSLTAETANTVANATAMARKNFILSNRGV